MNLRSMIRTYVPWIVIAMCGVQLFISRDNPNEAMAWLVAMIGWLAYKIESD